MAKGGRAHGVIGDLTQDEAVERLVRQAEDPAGPIAILVNNAGGSGGAREDWKTAQPASWTSAFDRNVLAALRVTIHLLPGMRDAKWGRVINISSLAATIPPPSVPEYSASKAAMNAMTASMVKAVAADGVTVNAVSPGTIHSATLDARFREVAAEQGLGEDAAWEDVERAVLPCSLRFPSVGLAGSTRSPTLWPSLPAQKPPTSPAPICGWTVASRQVSKLSPARPLL
jgi:NAD(P)-dependent dehydrogenase (short-subunit alcohol dehydrogenase family)